MDGRCLLRHRSDAGADAFYGRVLLDPQPAGHAGTGLEVGTHLRRDGVALLLAVCLLPVDEAPHHVVDGTDQGKEIGKRNRI